MGKLKVLDLFSGIGGFSLGLERTGGFETVAFCEIEEFPRKVLKKHWPEVPCFEDVRKLEAADVGTVDVICGGYPCQPFSTAGKRRGKEDDRHLWPEFSRLVAELRPTWVIGENVAGHISMGLDDVLSDLEGQGYACRTFVIPACAVSAPHRRDRVWTVAYSDNVLHARELDAGANCKTAGRGKSRDQYGGQASYGQRVRLESSPSGQVAPDSRSIRRKRGSLWRGEFTRKDEKPEGGSSGGALQSNAAPHAICGKRSQCRQAGRMGWEERLSGTRIGEIASEPFVRRGTHGISNRLDRLKALGNAVVPQIPEIIGHAILEAEAT